MLLGAGWGAPRADQGVYQLGACSVWYCRQAELGVSFQLYACMFCVLGLLGQYRGCACAGGAVHRICGPPPHGPHLHLAMPALHPCCALQQVGAHQQKVLLCAPVTAFNRRAQVARRASNKRTAGSGCPVWACQGMCCSSAACVMLGQACLRIQCVFGWRFALVVSCVLHASWAGASHWTGSPSSVVACLPFGFISGGGPTQVCVLGGGLIPPGIMAQQPNRRCCCCAHAASS